MAIKGVQKRRDFVAGRQVVNVCDHDIIRNYFFHWLNVGSGESRRDKGAVVPMSSWNNCDRAQAIFLVIILLFSLLISYYSQTSTNGVQQPPLYNSHYFWQTVHTLTPRVLSRIHCLAAEKSRVAKGNELPRGACGHASPRNVLKWICGEMQSGAFWDSILRNVTVFALTSSCADDFSDIVTYTL